MSAPTETLDHTSVAQEWLEEFTAAVTRPDTRTAGALFQPEGWWRDLLAFGWDLRSLQGAEAIEAFLTTSREQGPVRFTVTDATVVDAGGAPFIQAVLGVETDVGRGRGVLRLTRADDGTWRAWTLLTTMDELVGHEEASGARRPHGGPGGTTRSDRNWGEARQRAREMIDADPEVLVVGAGHAGLGLAARLGAMSVTTLVIDRNERVGDNWRNRYHSLVLHDPVWYDHLPYLPFPPTWPVYTPKDKLGDWLEFYASAMELDVWTGSELVSSVHDADAGHWTVTIRRGDGTERVLRPRHLVLATGVSGTEPNMPEVPGADTYTGSVHHSSTVPAGQDLTGSAAIVVGSCNSGHDIAQELHERGARVTMLQRSPSYVVSVEASGLAMAGMYDETGPPTDTADLLGASFPFNSVPEMHRANTAAMAEADSELLRGLEEAGFRLNSGIDGTGALMLFLQKGGGYYINVGCSELIAGGQIGIRSGVEIDSFTPDGVALTDGTVLEADTVVFATGFRSMVETARRLLGDEVAERCGPVWGLDEEGELRGIWRESGHDDLWFAGGNLAMARFYGRFLALQIKARLERIHPATDRAPERAASV